MCMNEGRRSVWGVMPEFWLRRKSPQRRRPLVFCGKDSAAGRADGRGKAAARRADWNAAETSFEFTDLVGRRIEMPRRNDIAKILVIGSGPIVIGQSAEFDYSGTQACKALKAEGYEVVLVNSNPASIMTDPEVADRTYIEPLTATYVEEILRVEAEMLPAGAGKFAVLPTVGGQTALNLAVDLADAGVLERLGIELIGAKLEAIKKAEDRLLFKDAMTKIGLDMPRSALVNNIRDGLEFAGKIGFPVVIRPSFTLGGSGGGIAYNREEVDGDPGARVGPFAGARVPARRERAGLEGVRAGGGA